MVPKAPLCARLVPEAAACIFGAYWTLLFVEVFGPLLIHLVPRAGGWNLLFQV